MADLAITLPNGTVIAGDRPVVILGANGSGKTRESRNITATPPQQIEFVNALRNTSFGKQLDAMSQANAQQQHNSARSRSRSQHWEMVSDFSFALSQLVGEDGDSARAYRDLNELGQSVKHIPKTALQIVNQLWTEVFPGRSLSWKDWAPIVENERGEVQSYTASQMSDGERSALYLMAKVLLAQTDQVMVIDEPETHFHSHLAVKLWDALERSRSDLRFVYVTHDLTFALSREPADFLLSDPRSGLVPIDVDNGLPAEIRRDILGAASFSYFASRIILCEGDEHSLDKLLFSAWFNGRDTVVLPVGSCEGVRQAVRALSKNRLVENLEAIGIVDRDFQPEAVFATLEQEILALPIHEIEGLLCIPVIVERLGQHLSKHVPASDVPGIIQSAVSEQLILKTAQERAKYRLLNQVEDIIVSTPAGRDEVAVREHFARIGSNLGSSLDAGEILAQELDLLRSAKNSGDVQKMIRLIPSKPLAVAVSNRLGLKPRDLFQLMHSALLANQDDALGNLGRDLQTILLDIGLPQRSVSDRPFAVAP